MISRDEAVKKCIRSIIRSDSSVTYDGARVINGYVQAIDVSGSNTVDVVGIENELIIRGASLSALDSSLKGDICTPTINSEVAVLINSTGSQAYVISFTHLSKKRIEVDVEAYIGATGVEEQNDDTDYDEVKETGYKTYLKSVPEQIDLIAEYNSNASKITVVYERVTAQSGDDSKIEIDNSSVKTTVGSSEEIVEQNKITINSTKIVLGDESSAQKILKGEDTKQLLDSFITAVSSIMVTTLAGPMPILNKVQVEALKTQLEPLLSTKNYAE